MLNKSREEFSEQIKDFIKFLNDNQEQIEKFDRQILDIDSSKLNFFLNIVSNVISLEGGRVSFEARNKNTKSILEIKESKSRRKGRSNHIVERHYGLSDYNTIHNMFHKAALRLSYRYDTENNYKRYENAKLSEVFDFSRNNVYLTRTHNENRPFNILKYCTNTDKIPLLDDNDFEYDFKPNYIIDNVLFYNNRIMEQLSYVLFYTFKNNESKNVIIDASGGTHKPCRWNYDTYDRRNLPYTVLTIKPILDFVEPWLDKINEKITHMRRNNITSLNISARIDKEDELLYNTLMALGFGHFNYDRIFEDIITFDLDFTYYDYYELFTYENFGYQDITGRGRVEINETVVPIVETA